MKITLTLISLILSGNIYAQEFTTIHQDPKKDKFINLPNLSIGDQLPEFIIPKIINKEKQNVKTSDFNDRLLIIDFWSVNCKGCVEALPKMDSLQKQFGSKVKILPVTYEKEEYVKNFWKINKYTKDLSLPSVVEDQIFSGYFKHQTIPHEVWVYKGKVIAITISQYVDASNISKVINEEKVNWPVKNDFYKFDQTKPLVSIDTNQINLTSSLLKYSAICGYIEGVNSDSFSGGSGIIRDSVRKTIRAYFLNQPAYVSYVLLYSKTLDLRKLIKPSSQFDPNQIIWNVSSRNKYQYISKSISGYEQDWVRKFGFCFESLSPDLGQTNKQIYKQIISDLNNLLELNVRWERRNEKVFVLTNYNKTNGLETLKDGVSASNLVNRLNQQEKNPYVFNETKLKVFLPATINDLNDIDEISKAILPYGLKLESALRDVDKLIFSEKLRESEQNSK